LSAARVFGLGTYPIEKPIHGGQRRVAAFKRFYENRNFAYTYACLYNPAHYKRPHVGPYDYELDTSKSELALTNLIGDFMAGHQAANDPATFQHFSEIFEQTSPDVIQLEQPFMWPLAKRLQQMRRSGKPLLVYSSHNIEAPLKRIVLAASQTESQLREKICSDIEHMEAELVRDADAIVCVSQADGEFYRHEAKSWCRIIVVPNGVDRPVGCAINDFPHGLSDFDGRRFLMTVSSSHVPTIDGMCHYVINGGVFCVPPAPSIAICGGIAGPIANHPEYRRCGVANQQRVRFFFDVSDSELSVIKRCCHGVFLPIRSGGGTNLKTAEALALGTWVVATSTALRGFERFSRAEGVTVADTPADFRQAMRRTLQRPPLEIDTSFRAARETLYWDRCFGDSELPNFLEAM
jgi:glycosyltransferase involved in cell wall biosynthesis